MKFDKENRSDVLERFNSLSEKMQATQGRFMQENSTFVNELQDIQTRLEELIDNQKEVEQNTSVKSFTQSDFNKQLDVQIINVFKKEGDVWLFDPLPLKRIPPFIPISERSSKNHSKSTRFISFINFKGGVGKTTLTANLAAAFATGNYRDNSNMDKASKLRVLIVDLDFQGTLSDRCVENRPLINAIKEGKTSARLLTPPKLSKITLEDLALDIVRLDGASIVSSCDELDLGDNEHFIKLAFKRRDIRYCYRLWFHQQQVFASYDLVIFDCPPRKTASSICALAASDFVFIPTAPEMFDINSVNRTISWLIKFKHNLKLPLKIGGIIFNRTTYYGKFTPAETEYKEKLKVSLQNIFSLNSNVMKTYVKENGTPSIFQSYVPKRQGSSSINGDRGDVLPGALTKSKDYPFFTDVATEMYERIYQ